MISFETLNLATSGAPELSLARVDLTDFFKIAHQIKKKKKKKIKEELRTSRKW